MWDISLPVSAEQMKHLLYGGMVALWPRWSKGEGSREYDIKYWEKELIINLNNGLNFGTFFCANVETKFFLF